MRYQYKALMTAAVMASLMPLSAAAKDGLGLRTTDLGSGIKIDLPSDWKLDGMVNIATNSPEARSLGVKAYEWRADTGTMRIAISYMMFPGAGARRGTDQDGSFRKEMLVAGTEQYLPLAAETKIVPIVFANGGVSGAYVTLHAKGSNSFPVFIGRDYKCVSVATILRGDGLLTISVGSPDCDSAEHHTAVSAVAALHE